MNSPQTYGPRVSGGLLLAGVALCHTVAAAPQPRSPSVCEPTGTLVQVPELPEASGLAASRRLPGRIWSHNDSGEPVLYALDGNGRVTGQLRLSGVTVEDWEALAVAPCSAGSCLYVGDIGDNDAERRRITVYRVPEPPDASSATLPADALHATYPDGAHDAETLLISPDGRLHIVTKGDTGAVAVYRFPASPQPGSTSRLERLGAARGVQPTSGAERITDGAVSPDGQWVVLRSRQAVMFHRLHLLFSGDWRPAATVALASIKEPQGEGITFERSNVMLLAGEGGGKSQPGTFARLTCAMDRLSGTRP